VFFGDVLSPPPGVVNIIIIIIVRVIDNDDVGA